MNSRARMLPRGMSWLPGIASHGSGSASSIARASRYCRRFPRWVRSPPKTTRSGSAAISAGGSAASADGSARPKCRSVTWASLRSGAVGADVLADEVHDRLRRCAGREDLGHAELLELGDVLVGDRAPDGDED